MGEGEHGEPREQRGSSEGQAEGGAQQPARERADASAQREKCRRARGARAWLRCPGG